MIAIDTNILVYAHRREAAEHDLAVDAIRSQAEAREPWAIPWPCVYEFFSVVTNPRIWKHAASTPAQAWSPLRTWFDSPSLRLLSETDGFPELLADFVGRPRVRGAVIHDARIAAICLAHGVSALMTRDRDFAQFPELRTVDPFQ